MNDEEPIKPTYRRSEIQSLVICGAWQAGDGENANFGTAFHLAIAAYWQQCRVTGEETRLADVDEIAHTAFFDRGMAVDPERWPEFSEAFSVFVHRNMAELGTLWGIEQTVLDDQGDFLVTATMDRLDRLDSGDPDDPPTHIRITDYKTQMGISPHDFQMRFYGAQICRAFPSVTMVDVIVDHVRVGRGVVATSYHREQLLGWHRDIMRAFRARLAERQPRQPHGGAACTYCALRFSCPKAVTAAQLVPENASQAEEIARDWLRLQAGVKRHGDALKTWFKRNPPMVIDDTEIGYMSSTKFELVDLSKTIYVLEEDGLDGGKLMTIPITKIPKRLRRTLIEMGAATESESTPSFKTRKAGATGDEGGDDT